MVSWRETYFFFFFCFDVEFSLYSLIFCFILMSNVDCFLMICSESSNFSWKTLKCFISSFFWLRYSTKFSSVKTIPHIPKCSFREFRSSALAALFSRITFCSLSSKISLFKCSKFDSCVLPLILRICFWMRDSTLSYARPPFLLFPASFRP